jgi:hypothetical protein
MAGTAPPEKRSFSDNAGYIVGIAMLVILFVNAGAGAVIANVAKKGGVKADHADHLAFTQLYLSTFLLSLTLIIAIAGVHHLRMYGLHTHWAVPLVVVILGAYPTGLPIHAPTAKAFHYNPRAWLVGMLVVALQAFAKYYGTAFFGGTVVGVAGGLLLTSVIHHRKDAAGPEGGSARRPGPAVGRGGHCPDPRDPGRGPAGVGQSSMSAAVAGVGASPAPRVPARTATFTKVTWGTVTPRHQARYHLEIAFTGLRGENCHVFWRTVYLDTGTLAETQRDGLDRCAVVRPDQLVDRHPGHRTGPGAPPVGYQVLGVLPGATPCSPPPVMLTRRSLRGAGGGTARSGSARRAWRRCW